jgi:hypothetical protein
MLFDGECKRSEAVISFHLTHHPTGQHIAQVLVVLLHFLRPRFVALSQQFVVGCLKKVKRVCYPCK